MKITVILSFVVVACYSRTISMVFDQTRDCFSLWYGNGFVCVAKLENGDCYETYGSLTSRHKRGVVSKIIADLNTREEDGALADIYILRNDSMLNDAVEYVVEYALKNGANLGRVFLCRDSSCSVLMVTCKNNDCKADGGLLPLDRIQGTDSINPIIVRMYLMMNDSVILSDKPLGVILDGIEHGMSSEVDSSISTLKNGK